MNEPEEKKDDYSPDVSEEINENSSCEYSKPEVEDLDVESHIESSGESEENLAGECAECTSPSESEVSEGTAFENVTSHFDEELTELNEKIDVLNKQFSDRIARNEYEAKIIQNMDSELKAYKDDLYRSLLKPLILEIIDLRESILKMSAFYLKKPEGEQAIPNATFADYAEDISDILEKYDVEVIKSNSGDDCVSLKHKILKTVPTDKESLHKKIAESLSSGYMYNGRVIYAERVNVYRFEEGTGTSKDVEDISNSENVEMSENTPEQNYDDKDAQLLH